MQLLSTRWSVSFGQFTLQGDLAPDALEGAITTSAQMKSIPAHPEGIMKIASPCGLYDPNADAVAHRFLDGRGYTWLGVGTRLVSNVPNPALVEAAFRARAVAEFGDSWDTTKKRRLNGLRKAVKRDLAERTPFRMSESGALFICLQTGETVSVGHGGMLVSKDLVGRIGSLKSVSFRSSDKTNATRALAILKHQEDGTTPWPTGTASLKRKREQQTESASVRKLNWVQSQDATNLIHLQYKPERIELSWADHSGIADLTGGLAVIHWPKKIGAADPQEDVEARLRKLLELDDQARALFLSASGESPLPLGA